MTKQFKPVAMRCNQEQYETLKDEIVKRGGKIKSIRNWNSFPYLTNNINGVSFEFGNTYDDWRLIYHRTVYETFDRNIFLEACGWGRKIKGYKRNPKMDVTAEQLAALLECSGYEENGLFLWGEDVDREGIVDCAQSLNIIGEDKMLVPVYEEEKELPSTDKTYTLKQYNTFNEMQKLALNEFVLVHKTRVKN